MSCQVCFDDGAAVLPCQHRCCERCAQLKKGQSCPTTESCSGQPLRLVINSQRVETDDEAVARLRAQLRKIEQTELELVERLERATERRKTYLGFREDNYKNGIRRLVREQRDNIKYASTTLGPRRFPLSVGCTLEIVSDDTLLDYDKMVAGASHFRSEDLRELFESKLVYTHLDGIWVLTDTLKLRSFGAGKSCEITTRDGFTPQYSEVKVKTVMRLNGPFDPKGNWQPTSGRKALREERERDTQRVEDSFALSCKIIAMAQDYLTAEVKRLESDIDAIQNGTFNGASRPPRIDEIEFTKVV